MDQLELLTVEHTFLISKPGIHMLVLSPKIILPKTWRERGWSERQEQVTVARPDGSRVTATAQLNMTHLNIRGGDVSLEARWPLTVWLTDLSEDEVPIGSRILVNPEVRAAILGVE